MRLLDNWRNLGLFFAAALLAGLAMTTSTGQVGAATANAPAPRTWTVLVGGEAGITQQEMGPAGAWQFMRFYPDTITINVGDTVVWKLNSTEPHTVTFPMSGQKSPDLVVPEGGDSRRMMLNPMAAFPQGGNSYNGNALVGSGQMDRSGQFPQEFKVTFTGAGSVDYFCAFHTMMTGKVIVQGAGSGYPQTREQIDASSSAVLASDAAAAGPLEPLANMVSTRPGLNGSTVYELHMGYGNGTMSWMRFGPTDLTIKKGDTVVWVQGDVDTPHTVTFTSGGTEPELVLPEPQPQGPPKLILNPIILAPAGGASYGGTGYYNSGFIWGTLTPIPGPHSYSLTFDTPGSFEYVCALHDMMGMKGQITVQP